MSEKIPKGASDEESNVIRFEDHQGIIHTAATEEEALLKRQEILREAA